MDTPIRSPHPKLVLVPMVDRKNYVRVLTLLLEAQARAVSAGAGKAA